jgi:hypothetical protein
MQHFGLYNLHIACHFYPVLRATIFNDSEIGIWKKITEVCFNQLKDFSASLKLETDKEKIPVPDTIKKKPTAKKVSPETYNDLLISPVKSGSIMAPQTPSILQSATASALSFLTEPEAKFNEINNVPIAEFPARIDETAPELLFPRNVSNKPTFVPVKPKLSVSNSERLLENLAGGLRKIPFGYMILSESQEREVSYKFRDVQLIILSAEGGIY